jgi:hypothetical protein
MKTACILGYTPYSLVEHGTQQHVWYIFSYVVMPFYSPQSTIELPREPTSMKARKRKEKLNTAISLNPFQKMKLKSPGFLFSAPPDILNFITMKGLTDWSDALIYPARCSSE